MAHCAHAARFIGRPWRPVLLLHLVQLLEPFSTRDAFERRKPAEAPLVSYCTFHYLTLISERLKIRHVLAKIRASIDDLQQVVLCCFRKARGHFQEKIVKLGVS